MTGATGQKEEQKEKEEKEKEKKENCCGRAGGDIEDSTRPKNEEEKNEKDFGDNIVFTCHCISGLAKTHLAEYKKKPFKSFCIFILSAIQTEALQVFFVFSS